MTSYEKVYSKFLSKITDYKLVSLNKNDLLELETEWLHEAFDNVEIRQMFRTLKLDDEIQQFSFTLNDSIDEESDESFVIDILALGMTIAWLTPQVNSIIYTNMYTGGKEEKKLYDGHSFSPELLRSLEVKLQKRIAKYGYFYGNIGGTS